jgi:hypothetical protein
MQALLLSLEELEIKSQMTSGPFPDQALLGTPAHSLL